MEGRAERGGGEEGGHRAYLGTHSTMHELLVVPLLVALLAVALAVSTAVSTATSPPTATLTARGPAPHTRPKKVPTAPQPASALESVIGATFAKPFKALSLHHSLGLACRTSGGCHRSAACIRESLDPR